MIEALAKKEEEKRARKELELKKKIDKIDNIKNIKNKLKLVSTNDNNILRPDV